MSDEIVDLVFAAAGTAVALDYADRLRAEIERVLPWLGEEPHAGVHPLSGGSPVADELCLSRRSRLVLRLPVARVAAARALSGHSLDLGGRVVVGEASERVLKPARVLYSAFVCFGAGGEDEFVGQCRATLDAAGFTADLVCGRARSANGADGPWRGFSLMLHGLGEDASMQIQRHGLGRHRTRGCGIFVPHKSIAAVGD